MIFNMTGGKCFYCGCTLDFQNFHVDHVIPKAKGGTDFKNIVPACPDCNMAKSDLSIEEFRLKIYESVSKTHVGRVISKYYHIEPELPVFWFEENL